MNGRQKAMTASLLGSYSQRDRAQDVDRAAQVEPLQFLKLIVEQVERGDLVLRNINVETFRTPAYRGVSSFDSPYEKQMIVSNDCYAGVTFEVVPSGRVRDGDEDRTISFRSSNPDDDMGELFGAELSDEESAPLESPTDRPSFDPVKRPKRGAKPDIQKPATPAGASAAREIIFDDDGNDPT